VLLSLVDVLRCPAEHELSSLVLSADRWAEGRVSSGVLGCPVCHARYEIRDGVADFARLAERLGSAGSLPETIASDVLRLAAQLDLSEGGGLVMLTAAYAMQSQALSAIVNATYLLVDAGSAIPSSLPAVALRLLDRIPLVDGALRAAAVDGSRSSASFLAEVSRCVRDGGRIVAPADAPAPEGVRLLARDDREWVGQVERFSSLVRPQRGVQR
jgi:uncharacterized protein YbaR (Trm112 family)